MGKVSLLALLMCVAPAYPTDAALFKIRVDISAAPELTRQAEESRVICEEWYPKINEILNGPGHELPFPEVLIIFAPLKGGGIRTGPNMFNLKTRNNVIEMVHAGDGRLKGVPAAALGRGHGPLPEDLDASGDQVPGLQEVRCEFDGAFRPVAWGRGADVARGDRSSGGLLAGLVGFQNAQH